MLPASKCHNILNFLSGFLKRGSILTNVLVLVFIATSFQPSVKKS